MMITPEIIAEATRKFPVGAECSNRNLGKGCDFIIRKITGLVQDSTEIVDAILIKYDGGCYTIYRDGIWADVISYPEGYVMPDAINNSYQIY